MASMKFTKEQEAAIYTRDANLLVAAAAGSGKTAVLVERIIKMITDKDRPIDIDRLLVVTFTNAAASEMRERIGKAISNEISKNPTSIYLQRQLTLLNKASITTIHSFCLDVIKRNFHMIDLDPNFRIADETETLILKQESLDEVFEEMYEEKDEYFLKLVESYCNNKNDLSLFEMVLDLYNFSMSNPYPEKWLNEKSELLNIEKSDYLNSESIIEMLKIDIKTKISEAFNNINDAKEIVDRTESLLKYQSVIDCDFFFSQNIKDNSNDLDKIRDLFLQLEFKKMPTISKCPDAELQKYVKKNRDNYKALMNEIKENIEKIYSNSNYDDLEYIYPLIKKLCELVIKLRDRYSEKKKEKAIIDFNDFEHFALKILTEEVDGKIVPSKVAEVLREGYDEILIDEYQDSNYIQEYILNMISKKHIGINNIFMVGDVKQSIYRFRMAKPELFLNKKETYSLEEGKETRLIKLYKNFRSRKVIIDSVNYVFRNIMSKELGELDYNEEEELNLGADYKEIESGTCGGPTEVILINKDELLEQVEDGDDEEPLSSIELEAKVVGKRILDLIDEKNQFKVFDNDLKDYRNVKYKDIVVLLRSTKKWAPVFAEELKNLGVPVYSDANDSYFNSLEIKIMLSLLEIIDNPIQDIPLLSVLRSPIVGFTSEEVVDIRLNSPETSIFEALKQYIELGENDELKNKVKNFLSRLKVWRDKSLIMPIYELVWSLYMETGYYGYVGAMPAGIKRQANLKMLFQRAKQYESTSYKGLFNFINFINKLRTSSGDLGSAKIIGENEDVVRIMSIHKSKGLEFPVVFLSGAGKKPNTMDIRNKILVHQELGFGPQIVDIEKRVSHSPLIREILKSKMEKENLSEEMRVLYVAFTRAKEKLIITGEVKSIEKSLEKWNNAAKNGKEKILEGYLLKNNTYLDWIMPTIIKHPDGKFLTEDLDRVTGTVILNNDVLWNVRFAKQDDLYKEDKILDELDIKEKLNKLNLKECNDELASEIINRLDFKYKYQLATNIKTNITVSEIKRLNNLALEEEFVENKKLTSEYIKPIVNRPRFLEEKKELTPAEKGTAMHAVMQRLDFNKISKHEIEEQIEFMVLKELLTTEQAKSIRINKIEAFLKSKLGKRVIEADSKGELLREVPFSIEVSVKEAYKELEGIESDNYNNDYLKVQGIIDGYFEEDGNIILFDYKTDYVTEETKNQIIEKYNIQLEYYKDAIERGTGKKVTAKYLYLFSIDEEVEC